MKTAVVFFSRDGNTRLAADLLAHRLGADVFELEEGKKRGKSAASFMAAGFGASFGLRSRLKTSFAQELREYDRICIGSPVWAGKTVPAVNAFIHGLDAAGKQIILFTVQADPQPETKAPQSLNTHKQALETKGASVTYLLRIHGAPPGKTADAKSIQIQLDNQLAG